MLHSCRTKAKSDSKCKECNEETQWRNYGRQVIRRRVWGMANCNRNVSLLKAGWPRFINWTNCEKGKAKKTWPAADRYLVKRRRASGEDGSKVDISEDKPCLRFVDESWELILKPPWLIAGKTCASTMLSNKMSEIIRPQSVLGYSSHLSFRFLSKGHLAWKLLNEGVNTKSTCKVSFILISTSYKQNPPPADWGFNSFI